MNTPPLVRVAFADDYRLIRAHIRITLSSDPAIEIVGEAENGDAMMTLCDAVQPDIALLDIHMPGSAAPEVVRGVLAASSDTKIIMVTAEDDDVYVRSMARLPICGYVLKGDIPDYLLIAIHRVNEGGMWYSPSLRASL